MEHNFKLLIIDDDETSSKLLTEIFSDRYILQSASSGGQALASIEAFSPDIVLLDIMLPDLDGLEVCRRIRNNSKHKFIKIILVSGKGNSQDRVAGYEAGADDYVVKPFNIDEFVAKVRVFSRLKFVEESDQALKAEKLQEQALIKQLKEAQNQLLQSEKMASIGQLAAGVAHEINNPVGYIKSNISSMQGYIHDLFAIISLYETAESELVDTVAYHQIQELKQKLDLNFLKQDLNSLLCECQEGVQRVKQIVQDLKDFSHVERAEWQWADLHKGLESTLNIVNNEIKYKAKVIKEYGELPHIESIPSQLNQVFLNLLVNAAHAIEKDGTITVRTCTCGSDWVCVQIEDTGRGIAPEHINRIFDPFFTTKPVGKGTGLGLSLSYSIVEKHGGHFDVQSESGKGTSFKIWLPVQQAKTSNSDDKLNDMEKKLIRT